MQLGEVAVITRPDEQSHQLRLFQLAGRASARVGSLLIAQSDRALLVEECFKERKFLTVYFPKEDLLTGLEKSLAETTYCPIKGYSQYWNIPAVAHLQNPAWQYVDTLPFDESLRLLLGKTAFDNRQVTVDYQPVPVGMRAFFAGGLPGNECELYPMPPIETASSAITQCFTWKEQGSNYVECRQLGVPLQLCSHGLLCAATWWYGYGSLDRLIMNGVEVETRYLAGKIFLSFPAEQLEPCPLPGWLPKENCAPVAAALSSKDDGYLIVQWPDYVDLWLLSIPSTPYTPSAASEPVNQHTQRAVIYTCRHDDVIQLRYFQVGSSQTGSSQASRFVPPHGGEEEAATGAAVKIVADYWSADLSIFTVVQGSPCGGKFQVFNQGNKSFIGGNCEAI